MLIRDKRCLRCGKESILHTSHIYPRGKYPRMQFLPDNVKLLCNGCHLYWWHKHPIEAKEWAEKTLGKRRLKKLKKISNTIKYGSYNYKEIKVAKRFIDTNIWNKQWFRQLELKRKLLWLYITTKCDHAGIWDADFEAASFFYRRKCNR